jgi:hypothetical protein
MEIAISKHYKGKPPIEVLKTQEYIRSFHNYNISSKRFAELVQEGYAFCSALTRPYRARRNFLSAPVIAMDFDTDDMRSSFDYLSQDPFISSYASFLYTTPSHTKEKPRARVVFEFSSPIFSKSTFEVAMAALLDKYGFADPACKDAARIFFGSPGCDIKHFGNTLPTKWFLFKVAKPYARKQTKIQEEVKKNYVSPTKGSNFLLYIKTRDLLKRVINAPEGERNNTLNSVSFLFGGLVAAGYGLTLEEASSRLMNAAANAANPLDDSEIQSTISKAIARGTSSPVYLEDPYRNILSAQK